MIEYQGKTGLIWFTGIIEDRNDPLFLNRVRVRIHGAHSYDKQKIATPDLPWSDVMMPTTSPSLSGLGSTTHGLVEGSTVMGFWRDGLGMQDPVIMGSFIGQPDKYSRKSITALGEEEIIRWHLQEEKGLLQRVKDAFTGAPSELEAELAPPIDKNFFGASEEETEQRAQLDSAVESGLYNERNALRESIVDETKIADATDEQLKAIVRDDDIRENVKDLILEELNQRSVEAGKGDPAAVIAAEAESKEKALDGFPEGFNDPRLQRARDYEDKPDGPNPQHMSNRNYGLTLDLDNSPRNPDNLSERNIWPLSSWAKHETAINYPKENYIGTSDVNKLARQDGKYDKTIWPNNFIENEGNIWNDIENLLDVPLTLFDAWGIRNNEDRSAWVRPKYPFNHVYESESGHVIEIDDTPGYERINLFHRKGARIEINNEGEIHIVAAPGQDFNLQAANVNIHNKGSGSLNINAEAEVKITAKTAAKIISEGPTDIISSGETKITALKDVIMKAVKKIKIQ